MNENFLNILYKYFINNNLVKFNLSIVFHFFKLNLSVF
jgi:hypothetical protein